MNAENGETVLASRVGLSPSEVAALNKQRHTFLAQKEAALPAGSEQRQAAERARWAEAAAAADRAEVRDLRSRPRERS